MPIVMPRRRSDGRATRLAELAVLGIALSLALPVTAGPCDAPAHRAFDFWIGEWQVRTPDSKVAGKFRESTDAKGVWTTAFDGIYSRK